MNPLKPKKKFAEEMPYGIDKDIVNFVSGTCRLPVDIDAFRKHLASMGILFTVCPRCGSVEIVRLKSSTTKRFVFGLRHKSRFKPKPLRFKCHSCDKEFEVREIDS